MRAADLRTAAALAEKHAANVAMRKRLESGEPLALMIGTGATAGSIWLTPSYVARIRNDMITALSLSIDEITVKMRDMGVEP